MNPNIINGHEFIPSADLRGIVLDENTYLGGIQDLHGIHLENSRLPVVHFRRGVNLQGAHFEGANLEHANLEGADLRGAQFQGAHLEHAILHGANLEGANLEGAQLPDTNLRGANLRGTNLLHTNLRGANLRGVINLNLARNVGTADFYRAILDVNQAPAPPPAPAPAPPPPPPPAAPAQPKEGRAYEVHNYFDSLDINAIKDFLREFNSTHKINVNSAPPGDGELFRPLIRFVLLSDLFKSGEKVENQQKLTRILRIAQGYEGFQPNIELLRSIIEFVSKQSDDFIEQYIRTIKDECLNAYGKGQESCVKGMFERILTILGTVAITLTQDGVSNQDNETYKTLKILFREINFVELVQEWSTLYLEGGDNEEELRNLSVEERKQHFIDFMITKYGLSITSTIRQKINQEAEEYRVTGVFDRMAFGVKRRKNTKRTTRRHPPRKSKRPRTPKRIQKSKRPKRPKSKTPKRSQKKHRNK